MDRFIDQEAVFMTPALPGLDPNKSTHCHALAADQQPISYKRTHQYPSPGGRLSSYALHKDLNESQQIITRYESSGITCLRIHSTGKRSQEVRHLLSSRFEHVIPIVKAAAEYWSDVAIAELANDPMTVPLPAHVRGIILLIASRNLPKGSIV